MINSPRSHRHISRFVRRSARRVLCGVLSSVLLFQPIMQVGAQGITPDSSGGKAPGVVAAPNGVPVVNIQAPNNGLSHNQYQDFNVGTQGVVLNNSPTAGRSELGGIVLGNPNLRQGNEAGLIINEVTSSNRSQLNGFLEVHGKAADVIVANPNGLSCDGCGFINTPRATLSTGRPVIGADGTLNGLDVNGGDIAIQGRGADASRIDAFDIVSRRVVIEAPVSAGKEINIIAGRNQVDYATRVATAKADDGSTKPTVAIDSRALGGMYAGKISLVSTEKGVGVNTRGDMATHAGQLTLTADGKLVMSGRTSSAGDTVVTSHSSDVVIEQQLSAQGKVAVTAAKGKATVQKGAVVAGDAGVAITAKDIANAGTTQSQSTVALNAAQKVDNSGTTAANDRVSVTAATVANSGIFQSNGLLYVKGHTSVDNSGTMMATGTLDLSGGTLRNSNTIATDGTFLFNSSHLENTDTGKIQFRNDLVFVLSGLFDNAGLIETTGALSFVADGINNSSTGVLRSGKSMDLRSSGVFGNDGAIEAIETLTLSAASIDNRAGGILRTNGLLDLKSTAGLSNAALMSGANGLRLDAGQTLANSGRLMATGTLSLRAGSLTNTAGAAIQSQGDLSVILAGSFWNAGLLEAVSGITVTSSAIDNRNTGIVRTDGVANLQGTSSFTNAGLASGLNGLSVTTSGAIDNRGEVLSSADLTLAGARLDNRGMLHAGEKLQLNTGDVVNAASGKLQAGGDLFAVLWGSLSNAGVLLGSQTLDLKVAGTLTNTHEIYAGETMRLTAGGMTNTGVISSMGALRGTLSSLANRGSLQAGTDMTLTGLASLHNTETLLALGNLRIEVRDSLVNEYGNILAGDLLQLRGQGGGRMGSLQNLSGTIESFDGDVDIAAQSLINAKAVFEMETVRTETLYPMLEENEHFEFNSLPGYQDTRWDNASYFRYVVLVPDPELGYDFATYYGVSSSGYSIYVWEDRSTVTRDSAPGVISAGRDLFIDAGYLLNDKSTIMSGEDMTLTGDVLENVGAVSTYQYWHASKAYGLFTRCFGGRYCEWFYNAAGEHLLIDQEIERHDASIVAGGDLSGSFRDRIDNTLIRERSNILPPGGKIKVTEVAAGAADQRNPGNIVPPELSGASSTWKSDARFTSVVNTAMSSLFRPASPSSPYLYESRAQFSSFGHFYGSDYFLSAINFNPDALVKRLGDAFFDTRLIREEVLRQTGQRWLDGSTRNDGDEMKRLMDNGIAASASLGLLPGQAPTAEQLAALDSDMVWYVWQGIGGQKVLGPQLYLAADSKRRAEGGAVIAGDSVSLDTGTLLNQGVLGSKSSLVVNTTGDLINQGGLISGETVLLSAGRDLINNAAMTSISSANNSNILLAGLGRIESSGSLMLFSERDVSMRGGNVAAGEDLSISARGNVTLESEVQRNQFTAGGGSSVTRSDDIRNIGSLVSAEGNVQISAGKQLSVAGSGVVAGKDATLSGKEGVTVTSVTDESHYYSHSSKKHTFGSSSSTTQRDSTTEMGSVIAAGNDLKIVSGGDVAIHASALNAGNDLLLAAGAGADGRKDANVTIEAGQNTSFFEQKSKKSGFGGLSGGGFGYSSSKSTIGQTGTQTVGSQVSAGNNVTILASQDINIAGSQVLAGNDALLSAGRDVTIATAQESSKSWQDSKISGFGVSINGPRVTVGASSSKDSVRQDGTYSVGSVISAGNDLTIDAGRNAMISGSWLSAGQDMAISGQQVAIIAADNLQTTKESHKQSQFGVTLGLSGAVGNAVTTAYDTGVRMTQVEDNRLKGALAGQAAYNAYKGVSAWNDYSTAMDKWNQIAPVDQAGLQKPSSPIGLSVSVGGSSSKSERSTSESWATASTLEAGRDISIIARGGDGVAGNLAIIGTDITAGRDVTLAAKDNILIGAAKQESEIKGKNSSSGGSIGFDLSADSGFTLNVSANMSKGKETGDGTTWLESTVKAGDTLTIVSGGDTTIRGAQVGGETVLANVGGNLSIESLQDDSTYHSKQTSGGASVSIPIGMAGTASGTVSINQQKIDHTFESVTEQSGIYAGSGGFDIKVGGNTDLVGAVIASTADADKNRLETETLTWRDLENHSETSASSMGGTLSYGADPGSSRDASMVTGIDIMPGMSESDKGTTHAAVAPGTIVIRDKDAQTQDLADLSRDTNTANAGAIQDDFDKRKIEERLEAGRIISSVGMQVVRDIAETQMQGAREKEYAAAEAEKRGDKEEAARLRAEAKEIADLWGDTGVARLAGHGLIGALASDTAGGSALAGGAGAIVGPLVADQIASHLNGLPQAVKDALLTAAATAAGAAVGGQNGAAMANSEVKNNFLTGDQPKKILDAYLSGKMTYEEATEEMARLSKENIEKFDGCLKSQDKACLTEMVAGIAGADPYYLSLGTQLGFDVTKPYQQIGYNAAEFVDNCTKGAGWMGCSLEQLAAHTAVFGAYGATGLASTLKQMQAQQRVAQAEAAVTEKVAKAKESASSDNIRGDGLKGEVTPGINRQLTASEQKSISSLEDRISEHQQKLELYKSNPELYDNLGYLQNAPNEVIRQRIIDSRIRHLEKEISTFQKNIDDILKK